MNSPGLVARLGLMAALALPATAAETNVFISFTNNTGPHLNVRVLRVTETTAFWRDTNSASGGSIKLADLPENLRRKFGFDQTKAEQLERAQKVAQEAARQKEAALNAEADKLQHWEELAIIDMKPALWSRQECAVRNEKGERLTVLIANLPPEIASLPRQLQAEQDKLTSISQQIQFGQTAIAQAQADKQAAWNRYALTPDNYSSVTVGSRGSSVDNAATRLAAPHQIQAQIDQAQVQLANLRMQQQEHLAAQNELKFKLVNARVKAFFTGRLFNGLQIWDCAPRGVKAAEEPGLNQHP